MKSAVLALLVLSVSALEIAEEKPTQKQLKLKKEKEEKKKEQELQCVRDDKPVPRTSGGPRRVRFEETKEEGYFSKPQLKKIIYLNQDFDTHRDKKMQMALHATLKNTEVGNESTIEIE